MKNLFVKNWILALLVVIQVFPLMAFFGSGLPETHDGRDHVARIANFYQNLKDGNIVPRWAANLNWGYGHPVLMFLYPLPSYAASFFHFLGFSLVDSTKAVFIIGYLASGLTMFIWIKELLGGNGGGGNYKGDLSAFAAAILYQFAPYRFVDMYVRGAIGEHFFFIWPPLVLYFLTKLSKSLDIKPSLELSSREIAGAVWMYIVGGSLSLAAMLLSHNALSLMFLPFIFGYMVILLWQAKRKLLVTGYWSLVTGLGFGSSAFFWLPAFFEGKYTLRDIVTEKEFADRFESFGRLLYSPWSYGGSGQFSVQVGGLQWAMVLLAPFLIYWTNKTNRTSFWLLVLALIAFWLSIFLMLPISGPIYEGLTVLQKFQFPWRFLSLVLFPPAIFAAVLIYLLPKRFNLLSVTVILFFALLLNRGYWHAKDYRNYPEEFFTEVYHGTTDTGESSPIWSVRFMEKEAASPIELIEGEAEIEETERKTAKHTYKIRVTSEKARVVENTLYFPGWFIYDNGKQTDVEFQDPAYRGLMTFWLSTGEHEVSVWFKETKLRLFANVVSLALFSTFFLGGIALKSRWAKPR